MKSLLFNKENIGVIHGVLSAENEVTCDENGHVTRYRLTGNIRPCEFNDVIITGKRVNPDTIEVGFMESFPCTDEWTDFIMSHENGTESYGMNAYVIPPCRIKEIKKEITTKGTYYHDIAVDLREDPKKNKEMTTIHFKIFNFEKDTMSGNYLFIVGTEPEFTESEFGSGYGKKTVKTAYIIAQQVRS